MNATPYYIREHTYPNGSVAYRLSGMHEGKQIRWNYKTMAEAMAKKQELDATFLNMPKPVPLVRARLTEDQAAEAERAYAELSGFPLSLLETVRWARANYTDPEKKITVTDAFAKFLEHKRSSNLRPATLRKLNQRVGLIAKAFPQRIVSDIQAEDLRELIFRKGSGLVNQETDYRAFTNFFNWAVSQSYCKANPMDRVPRIKLDRDEPVIMPLPRVRALITAAMDYKDGVCLPYVVLGLFCAIRPTELSRLTWDDIDLQSATVTIGAKIAKMRARRLVSIPANALAFLRLHVARRTPLVGKNWRRDFDAVKESAGYGGGRTKDKTDLEPWTMDIMRHTGISYHLAEHQHEGQTAAWAGNSPDVIQKHYKGLVKPTEAREFWSIVPSKKKIIKMGRAA